ncbi:MAG: alanyl-tRNA editing protein [Proteobacteria bacterium]|nr:MAG: alanyl-tRNA editing protein [Pseudomonadota bacterium]QKK11066.1 MAG: alanyl-tRNA editing protein [Pseudomonadota bacterium]
MTEELFREDAYQRECEALITAADERGIRLDRTVFYPQGGGQPGDQGILRMSDGREIVIIDTRKGEDDILHISAPGSPMPKVGSPVTAMLDWSVRYPRMRMHTCLHLLSAVLPYPVTGGSVRDDSGRLDFDLPESPDKEQASAELNRLITADRPVTYRWISDAELDAQPDLVKTLSVQPPRGQGQVRLVDIADTDLQPCGGTHVARTGEIGRVRISKIEKKGRQNRRVNIVFDP